MTRMWRSIAFRLALGYGILVISSMSVISAVFYIGTVGVLARGTDARLMSVSRWLVELYRSGGDAAVRDQINQLLGDRLGDEDTEVYLLTGSDGRRTAGNISGWAPSPADLGEIRDHEVTRNGRLSTSRLFSRELANGGMLVVGRNMSDRLEIEALVWRALIVGGLVTLLLAAGGAVVFRIRLERSIAAIRGAARDIEAGDLSRRITIYGDDEFSRLGQDINHMLDRIEHLMDGVRHVSNAIAHDLRTPLGRIRGQLDEALRAGKGRVALTTAAQTAVAQIDEVIRFFERLLQVAEAEAGTRRQSFVLVPMTPVVRDVVELYDAAAEARGISLLAETDEAVATIGDRHLLANAIANLVDNAIKYAGEGATVRVRTIDERDRVSVLVEDDGPGIPPTDRPRAVELFYRRDCSCSEPGSGLGLSIVKATASLHRGTLILDDAMPGLTARISLPRADPPPAGTALQTMPRGSAAPMPGG